MQNVVLTPGYYRKASVFSEHTSQVRLSIYITGLIQSSVNRQTIQKSLTLSIAITGSSCQPTNDSLPTCVEDARVFQLLSALLSDNPGAADSAWRLPPFACQFRRSVVHRRRNLPETHFHLKSACKQKHGASSKFVNSTFCYHLIENKVYIEWSLRNRGLFMVAVDL